MKNSHLYKYIWSKIFWVPLGPALPAESDPTELITQHVTMFLICLTKPGSDSPAPSSSQYGNLMWSNTKERLDNFTAANPLS